MGLIRDFYQNMVVFSETIFQTLVFLALSPGVLGLLRWMEARVQGRRGPSVWQPYYNLNKLFRRRMVIPETTSWVFGVAPMVAFCCYLLVGMLTPVIFLPTIHPEAVGVEGPPFADLLVVIYLIGLARFALGLAGMDSGSPFTGLGSGREMFLQILAEPVLMVCVYVLALDGYTTSLSGVILRQESSVKLLFIENPLFLLVLLALMMVMLIESGRIPYDDPESNLELGMMGKAVHLEYGGPFLALLQWTEAMRLTFFLTLLLNLAMPAALAGFPALGIWARFGLTILYPLKLAVALAVLAFWEVTRAKMRLRLITGKGELALVYGILAVFAVVVTRYFFYN